MPSFADITGEQEPSDGRIIVVTSHIHCSTDGGHGTAMRDNAVVCPTGDASIVTGALVKSSQNVGRMPVEACVCPFR